MGVVVRMDNGRETTLKGNNDSGWSSDGVVLLLVRRQNGDMVEWWGEWPRLRWPFYSSAGWEWGCLRRVAGGGGVDSMLQFWLERGVDGTKRCQKMKWMQQTHLGSMGMKRDMSWRCGGISRVRSHRGGEREETTTVGLTRILLGQKMKKIHAVNSVASNGWWKFKATMSFFFLKIYASEI
jgi:hypothetical protein